MLRAATLVALALLAGTATGTLAAAESARPAPARSEPARGVDLHAHLFMEHGLSPLFRGDFAGPIRARDWRAKFSSQTSAEDVDAGAPAITVVALYAHPVFASDRREAIRRQIAAARAFVAARPAAWAIAASGAEARARISEGRRVLVLSLEGGADLLETERDLREFVDEGGIRVVTAHHLTDDEWGGVALLRGLGALASPWGWLASFLGGRRDSLGNRVNPRGLTFHGRDRVRALLDRGVWIDLAHAPDAAMEPLLELLRARGQPLLVTHTALRTRLGAERGVPGRLLEIARAWPSGSVFGLIPSDEMLVDVARPDACRGWAELDSQRRELRAAAGPAAVITLGTDFNGTLRHLPPGCALPPEFGDEGGARGWWRFGQWRQAARAWPETATVEGFVAAWERVRPAGAR